MFRSTFFAVAGASVLTLAAAACPALAQGIDGVWDCQGRTGGPVGTVTVSGSGYVFESRAGEKGSGQLAFDGGAIVPQGGPLAVDLALTGSLEGETMYWSNRDGWALTCWRR